MQNELTVIGLELQTIIYVKNTFLGVDDQKNKKQLLKIVIQI